MSQKSVLDISTFVSTLILSLYFNIVGYFYIGEVVAVIYVVFHKVNLPSNFRKAISLIALWMFVQILSDIENNTTLYTALKGILAPLLLICTAIFFYDFFLIYPKKFLSFFLAFTLATLMQTIYNDPDLFFPNPWKWGIAAFVNFMFSFWFSYLSKKPSNKILFTFAFIFFVFSNIVSARSLGGICLASYIIYFLIKKPSISLFLKKIIQSNFGMPRIIFTLFFLLFFINIILTNLFLSDFYLSKLDEKGREKVSAQANGEYGALLGGRSESLISIKAFFDKPLLGHGSWAKDDGNYIDRYIDIVSVGMDESSEVAGREYTKNLNLIPTHSYLMGALVWGGAIAGLFWFMILGKIIRLIFLYANKVNFFFVYICVGFFWDILFSPFGYDHRYTSAALVAFLLFYENKLKVE